MDLQGLKLQARWNQVKAEGNLSGMLRQADGGTQTDGPASLLSTFPRFIRFPGIWCLGGLRDWRQGTAPGVGGPSKGRGKGMAWARGQGGCAAPQVPEARSAKLWQWQRAGAMLCPSAHLRPQRPWDAWPCPGLVRAQSADSEGGLQGFGHEGAVTRGPGFGTHPRWLLLRF